MNQPRNNHFATPARRGRHRAVAVLIAALAWLVTVAAVAHDASAETGGTPYWRASATGGAQPWAPTGDSAKHRRWRAPVITGSSLRPGTLVAGGRPLTLRYRVKGSAPRVHVRVIVRTRGGKYVRTLDLGVHRTRVLQQTTLTQDELGARAAGTYKLKLSAIDGRGRRAARAAKVPEWLAFSVSDYRFPLTGQFSFGGDDARFGAGRPGHVHQGQDVIAAAGVPVVAPHDGTISWVKYQADGAGYYVVLAASDGRDYVFMHLQQGSIAVKQGDQVATGRQLGRVGATGDASGPHLHFEVWVDGPWQFGGHPIDPLPLLRAWFATAPGGAVQSAAVSVLAGPYD